MDRDQVRARIVEVVGMVKQALIANRYSPKDGERGHKYIDDVGPHLRRLFRSFDLLGPAVGSSVFEIGTGHCYFLFLCRELRGCRPAGVDVLEGSTSASKAQARFAYRLFRKHFGLEDAIRHHVVEGHKPIDFRGQYDYIVATRATFNRGWGEGEHRFWLHDCYDHLRPGGKLAVHFNTVDPAALAALPLLRPLQARDRVKKLAVLTRETIGLALGATA
jgi:SAM-dependent methyltransferase